MFMIEFNEKFQKALDLLENSTNNLFITGKAGTGKSTLLNYFMQKTPKKVVLLAHTGVAALNVKGATIHSFFKFKPGITQDSVNRMTKNWKNREIFESIDLIIIDEISMVRADLLDCIDLFLRRVLKQKKPFGGVRMAFIGDLYQLPPVLKGEEKTFFQEVYETPYFFSAQVFAKSNFKFLELDKVYRQKDAIFVDLLNGIRKNTIDDLGLALLNKRVLTPEAEEGYIYLTSTNAAADEINRQKLSALSGKSHFFEADIDGNFDEKISPTDPSLELKVGAQVMFLNNHQFGLWVNGSVGKVVDLSDEEILVEKQDGERVLVEKFSWTLYEYIFQKEARKLTQDPIGSFKQYPLKLAWGITIHKSQGKTFDKVIIDLGRGTFACGQTYVALSRCRSLDGLILKKPLQKKDIFTDHKIVKFLVDTQYELSEKECSKENKMAIIERAIKEQQPLKIVYLKTNDEKSARTIVPLSMGQMQYQNKGFLGLEAFCQIRGEKRVFRIDRILEISDVS